MKYEKTGGDENENGGAVVQVSRLYTWLNSDMSQNPATKRAHQRMKVKINYGSKSDSKKLLELIVNYPENEEPQVLIRYNGETFELDRNNLERMCVCQWWSWVW